MAMIRPHRSHPLWFAYALHRASGIGLVLFLPLHFLMLSQALHGAEALDAGLRWTDNIGFKLAETGLVFLLAVHMFGGIRLLALEFLPWSNKQKTFAALAVACAICVSLMFFLSAI